MGMVVIQCDPCKQCERVFACSLTGAGVSVDVSNEYVGPGEGNAGTLPDGNPVTEANVQQYADNQDDPDGTLGTVDGFRNPEELVQEQEDTTGVGSPVVTPPPVVGCDFPSGFNWASQVPTPASFSAWAGSPGTYPEVQLSTNYNVAELTVDSAVSRYTFNASPTLTNGFTQEFVLENLCYHANTVLEPMIADSNVPSMTVTSGFRRKTGGSQHNKGQATDLQFFSYHGSGSTRQQYYDLAVYIRDTFDFDQLILEWFGNNPWIHISTNQAGHRGSVLTQTGKDSYAPGLFIVRRR